MNEEACRECLAGATQARGMDLAWRCMKHGVVRLADYEVAHRTFTAEDVERAARAFLDSAFPRARIAVTPEVRRNVRAALGAIGTVEEAS